MDTYLPAALCGAIAQLGERFHGMEEVVGSIPTSSTNTSSQDVPRNPKSVLSCWFWAEP